MDDDDDAGDAAAEAVVVQDPCLISVGGENLTVPAWISSKLFPHQKEGLEWLLARFFGDGGIRGGILGDGTGLGKTLQAIALVATLVENQKAHTFLIVAPASLTQHWEIEIRLWAPELEVARVSNDSQITDAKHTLERLTRPGVSST